MSDAAGGLSDALRNMADGEHEEAPDVEHDAAGEIEEGGYLEDEAGDVVASAPEHHEEAAPAAQSSRSRSGSSASARARKAQAKRRNDVKLKSNMIPVLFTMGILMLLIGTWALLVVMKIEGIPLADRPNATGTAMVMLACIPVGLALLGGGVLFAQQVMAAKKKM
ncbi:MAG: hypothetical protein MI741_16890 [Rhodospirillales bacterium]|nr:hypothetical protein [Rhodospirillales bacterium]